MFMFSCSGTDVLGWRHDGSGDLSLIEYWHPLGTWILVARFIVRSSQHYITATHNLSLCRRFKLFKRFVLILLQLEMSRDSTVLTHKPSYTDQYLAEFLPPVQVEPKWVNHFNYGHGHDPVSAGFTLFTVTAGSSTSWSTSISFNFETLTFKVIDHKTFLYLPWTVLNSDFDFRKHWLQNSFSIFLSLLALLILQLSIKYIVKLYDIAYFAQCLGELHNFFIIFRPTPVETVTKPQEKPLDKPEPERPESEVQVKEERKPDVPQEKEAPQKEKPTEKGIYVGTYWLGYHSQVACLAVPNKKSEFLCKSYFWILEIGFCNCFNLIKFFEIIHHHHLPSLFWFRLIDTFSLRICLNVGWSISDFRWLNQTQDDQFRLRMINSDWTINQVWIQDIF